MRPKTSFLQKTALVIFGLFLSLLILEIGMRAASYALLAVQEYENQRSLQKTGLRILCLGESTTQGQYPSFLEKILNQNKRGIKFSVIDKGLGGTQTNIILSKLEAQLDAYQPKMVVVMMGINNAGQHMPLERADPPKKKTLKNSFKVYKLVRFLKLRWEIKLKEWSFVWDAGKKSTSRKTPRPELPPPLAGKAPVVPQRDFSYSGGDTSYLDKNFFIEMEKRGKKAIENASDPVTLSDLWGQMSRLYRNFGHLAESEKAIQKAIEIDPRNKNVYAELGVMAWAQKKYAEAERAFRKAIELGDNFSLNSLASLYEEQGRFSEAEVFFRKAIETQPDFGRLYGRLAVVYSEMGDQKNYARYTEKANAMNRLYIPGTVYNYQNLKRILDQRRIRLVCVQYPMLEMEPLKAIFKEETEEIIFVDNEKLFKNAVAEKGYLTYFVDIFGGNFGHCTDLGNELLAHNIANAILKEVLKS